MTKKYRKTKAWQKHKKTGQINYKTFAKSFTKKLVILVKLTKNFGFFHFFYDNYQIIMETKIPKSAIWKIANWIIKITIFPPNLFVDIYLKFILIKYTIYLVRFVRKYKYTFLLISEKKSLDSVSFIYI